MTLAVEHAVLRSAGAAFEQSADDLADLQAQTPLNGAAVAVPSLTTAGTCRVAASELAAEVPLNDPGEPRAGWQLHGGRRRLALNRGHSAPMLFGRGIQSIDGKRRA